MDDQISRTILENFDVTSVDNVQHEIYKINAPGVLKGIENGSLHFITIPRDEFIDHSLLPEYITHNSFVIDTILDNPDGTSNNDHTQPTHHFIPDTGQSLSSSNEIQLPDDQERRLTATLFQLVKGNVRVGNTSNNENQVIVTSKELAHLNTSAVMDATMKPNNSSNLDTHSFLAIEDQHSLSHSLLNDGQFKIFHHQSSQHHNHQRQSQQINLTAAANPPLPQLTPIRRLNRQCKTSINLNSKDTILVESLKVDDDIVPIQPFQQRPIAKKVLPHKKRITKKLKSIDQRIDSIFTPPSNNGGPPAPVNFFQDEPEEVHQVENFTLQNLNQQVQFCCQICGLSVESQLEFFSHLKSHYEPKPDIIGLHQTHVISQNHVLQPEAHLQNEISLSTKKENMQPSNNLTISPSRGLTDVSSFPFNGFTEMTASITQQENSRNSQISTQSINFSQLQHNPQIKDEHLHLNTQPELQPPVQSQIQRQPEILTKNLIQTQAQFEPKSEQPIHFHAKAQSQTQFQTPLKTLLQPQSQSQISQNDLHLQENSYLDHSINPSKSNQHSQIRPTLFQNQQYFETKFSELPNEVLNLENKVLDTVVPTTVSNDNNLSSSGSLSTTICYHKDLQHQEIATKNDSPISSLISSEHDTTKVAISEIQTHQLSSPKGLVQVDEVEFSDTEDMLEGIRGVVDKVQESFDTGDEMEAMSPPRNSWFSNSALNGDLNYRGGNNRISNLNNLELFQISGDNVSGSELPKSNGNKNVTIKSEDMSTDQDSSSDYDSKDNVTSKISSEINPTKFKLISNEDNNIVQSSESNIFGNIDQNICVQNNSGLSIPQSQQNGISSIMSEEMSTDHDSSSEYNPKDNNIIILKKFRGRGRPRKLVINDHKNPKKHKIRKGRTKSKKEFECRKNDTQDDEFEDKKDKKKYICDKCNKVFNSVNALKYHDFSHSGKRPHQCNECGKSFFAQNALRAHLRVHSGEKPFTCEDCGRAFRQWGDLNYHKVSLHSNEKNFQCEFCGKAFARKYSLVIHRRIHTQERNYKCEFCPKTFRASSYLQNHRKIHTGEKPYCCPTCNKKFRVCGDLKRHQKIHDRSKKISVRLCDMMTNEAQNFTDSPKIEENETHQTFENSIKTEPNLTTATFLYTNDENLDNLFKPENISSTELKNSVTYSINVLESSNTNSMGCVPAQINIDSAQNAVMIMPKKPRKPYTKRNTKLEKSTLGK